MCVCVCVCACVCVCVCVCVRENTDRDHAASTSEVGELCKRRLVYIAARSAGLCRQIHRSLFSDTQASFLRYTGFFSQIHRSLFSDTQASFVGAVGMSRPLPRREAGQPHLKLRGSATQNEQHPCAIPSGTRDRRRERGGTHSRHTQGTLLAQGCPSVWAAAYRSCRSNC